MAYFIVESRPTYYHNDKSISHNQPIERMIVEIEGDDVTYMGGDCPSSKEELERNWDYIREININI